MGRYNIFFVNLCGAMRAIHDMMCWNKEVTISEKNTDEGKYRSISF